jgi:hypothetical protein
MLKLYQAIGSVLGGTLAGGLAGGLVGAAIGNLAPSFVLWFHSPVRDSATNSLLDPVEFGLGLGSVSGLFFGAATSVMIVFAVLIRDAIVSSRAPQKPAGVASDWT